MKQFLKFFLASFVAVFLFFVLLLLLIPASFHSLTKSFNGAPNVKEHTILRLSLSASLPDHSTIEPMFPFSTAGLHQNVGLYEISEALKTAATDEDVDGVMIDMGMKAPGLASIEELREALKLFRQSGKFVVATGQWASQKSYYLASVADSIFMEPSGILMLKGFAARSLFFKRGLEKAGISINIWYHGRYKSATEPLRNTQMSVANKEQLRSFLHSIYDQMLSNIGGDRGLEPESLNGIIKRFEARNPVDAKRLHLIDNVLFGDEVRQRIRDMAGLDRKDKLHFMSIGKYAEAVEEEPDMKVKNKIALIFMEGDVVNSKAGPGQVGALSFAKIFRDIRQDTFVKAVVVRINSPGGDAAASDRIWREIKLTAEKKPLIVSMGNLAASAGYQIAAPAKTIFVQPNTLTGSIGIFALWPNLQGLTRDKLGIDLDTVKVGAYSDLLDPYRPLEPDEVAFFKENIDLGYQDFLEKVAEGRQMDTAQVRKLAEGRIWSGNQAIEKGLADHMGGIDEAIEAAKNDAGLESYRLSVYPKKVNPFEMFRNLLGDESLKLDAGNLLTLWKSWQTVQDLTHFKGLQKRLPFNIEIE